MSNLSYKTQQRVALQNEKHFGSGSPLRRRGPARLRRGTAPISLSVFLPGFARCPLPGVRWPTCPPPPISIVVVVGHDRRIYAGQYNLHLHQPLPPPQQQHHYDGSRRRVSGVRTLRNCCTVGEFCGVHTMMIL